MCDKHTNRIQNAFMVMSVCVDRNESTGNHVFESKQWSIHDLVENKLNGSHLHSFSNVLPQMIINC